MPSFEHHNSRSVNYTLYRSERPSGHAIVFIPGMACNRYGHPVVNEPKGAVADLVEITSPDKNIIFPDIHQMSRLATPEQTLSGTTILQQNERILTTVEAASRQLEFDRLTFVAQSLGCLAVAALAEEQSLANYKTSAVLWGPPTYEGVAHRIQLVSMFDRREKTFVDEDGMGHLQFGDGRLMNVDASYWDSIDNNSIRIHHDTMAETYNNITAFCASEDHFYPNNSAYFAQHAPAIKRIEIPGRSHTFKPEDMRASLRANMQRILKD